MSRSRGKNKQSFERGAPVVTKQSLHEALTLNPDYKPIFTNSTLRAAVESVKQSLPVEVGDRRYRPPVRQVIRNQRISRNTNRMIAPSGGLLISDQQRELVRFLECSRRIYRKAVILSKFLHGRGGMGAARRLFKKPEKTWKSKIKC